jgi:acetyl-CoA synthetase (ADP-forming)
MLTSIEESPVYPIVNPRSVAFFGASNRFSSMGTNLLTSLKMIGFKGKIYPVHRTEDRVLDLPAYRSVLDLPEVPDLAVIVLPTGVVSQAVEECGRKGIRHAIVVSGGFNEVGGDGVHLERDLIEIADRYGIRFLGPNCIGVVNPHHPFNVTFFHYEVEPGFIGMASQSGSFITQMFDYLSRFGLGFSTGFSVGNEANIDIVDCMEYLAACPHTRVIALYIEAIRRGRAFIEAARSIVPHKPIVAFYVGGSEAGKRAGLSHTGAMAGPDELYEGVFRQSGIIRAHSVEELFDFCWVLGTYQQAGGNRVVIQTHSGGPGAAAADACGRVGLEMPILSDETQEKLELYVPHTGTISNPVDITFSKNNLDFFSNIPGVLLDEGRADILLIYFYMPGKMMKRSFRNMGVPDDQVDEQSDKFVEDLGAMFGKLRTNHHKPIIGYTYDTNSNPIIRAIQSHGIPVIPGPGRAARAMEALVRYSRYREGIQ